MADSELVKLDLEIGEADLELAKADLEASAGTVLDLVVLEIEEEYPQEGVSQEEYPQEEGPQEAYLQEALVGVVLADADVDAVDLKP